MNTDTQKIQIRKFNRMLRHRVTRRETATRVICDGGPFAGSEIMMTTPETAIFRCSNVSGRYCRFRQDQQNARIWGLVHDARAYWVAS